MARADANSAGITKLHARAGKARAASGAATGMRLVKKAASAVGKASKRGAAKAKLSAGRGRGVGASSRSMLNAQRVVVRAQIVKMKGNVAAQVKRHIGYVGRDGAGEDGTPGRAFNQDGALSPEELEQFSVRAEDVPHQFRIIVSPEHGNDMDMERSVHSLIARMQTDLGTKLDYISVVHHDTDQPHAHVIINGKDDRGGDLVISREYLSHGLRERAREVATDQLGYRTDRDVANEITSQITRNRYTSIDSQLERGVKDGVIDLRVNPKQEFAREMRKAKLQRLSHLSDLGVASESAPGVWRLDDEFKERLREIGGREVVRNIVEKHVPTSERVHGIVILKSDDLKPISGVVVGAGLHDELGGSRYAVIALDNGKVGYMAVSENSERGLPNGVRVGDRVDLEKSTYKATGKADDNIAEFSKSGVYDKVAHLDSARATVEAGRSLPGGATPEEFISAHERRLDALASRGHVARTSADMYRVPSDFRARMEEEAQGRANNSFIKVSVRASGQLESLSQGRGFGWIDEHIERNGVNGIGAPPRNQHQRRLDTAIRARVEVLGSLGIANVVNGRVSLAPNARNQINSLAVQELSRELTTDQRQYAGLDARRGYSGVVTKSVSIGGQPYAVIEDSKSATFTLATAPGFGKQDTVGRAISVALPEGAQLHETVRYKWNDRDKQKVLGISI